MKQVWIITMRELRGRIWNRSFLLMLVIGPFLLLTLAYFLVKANDEGKNKLTVLIDDPNTLIRPNVNSITNRNINYVFHDGYLDRDQFKRGKEFQKYDALIEVNPEVLKNKKVFVFYRGFLSEDLKNAIKFNMERRVEEVMINWDYNRKKDSLKNKLNKANLEYSQDLFDEYTGMTINDFRQIKQPLNMDYRNVDDPYGMQSHSEGYLGLIFGIVIIVFILLFGLSIMRGIAREKSNRIIEVLVSVVKPRRLMLGKILGVGLSALVQLFAWSIIVGIGFWFFQNYVFSEFFISDEFISMQINEGDDRLFGQYNMLHQNEVLDLIYERLNLSVVLPIFLITFILGYVFYGTFFSLIGAGIGSESDGQQFSIPVIMFLLFALYAGYFSILHPESDLTRICEFIPFTSPVIIMVKTCQGYPSGSGYLLVVSLFILFLSSLFMLYFASRIFRNGVLEFGHSLSIRKLFIWLKSDA